MKGEYLSNIIDLNNFKKNCLNLIEAPCGSGKTTFAIQELKKINPSPWGTNMLYLIDGTIGKEQLLRTKGVEYGINEWTGLDEWKIQDVRVMTYAGYAMLCEKVPEKDIWNEETLILCDELQNAILWSCFQSENNIHKKALYLIKKKINSGNNIVVAISATPSIIKESFYRINEIPLLGTPRHYENEEIIKYNDIMLLINKLTPDKKGIIYISQISQIKKCQKILDDKGFRTSAIWSINNTH